MFIDGVSYAFKMYEYRRKKSATGENEEQSAQAHRANTTDHRAEEPYLNLAKDYGLVGEMDIGESDPDTQTVEQEYQAYATGKLSKHASILKFWEVGRCCVMILQSMLTALQNNCTTFPTLFAIAMDYIPVQASSVPCERVFSSSAETDTKRRNRISPMLMEALQTLKFHLKKEHLDFTAGWMTKEKQMVEDSPEVDLLQKVLQESSKDQLDSLDTIIQADED
jgi:hAT family C-terminal dimerisation region